MFGVSVGAIVPDCGVTRIRYSISLPCGTGKIQLGVVDMLCCRGAAPHFINMPAAVDANANVKPFVVMLCWYRVAANVFCNQLGSSIQRRQQIPRLSQGKVNLSTGVTGPSVTICVRDARTPTWNLVMGTQRIRKLNKVTKAHNVKTSFALYF